MRQVKLVMQTELLRWKLGSPLVIMRYVTPTRGFLSFYLDWLGRMGQQASSPIREPVPRKQVLEGLLRFQQPEEPEWLQRLKQDEDVDKVNKWHILNERDISLAHPGSLLVAGTICWRHRSSQTCWQAIITIRSGYGDSVDFGWNNTNKNVDYRWWRRSSSSST